MSDLDLVLPDLLAENAELDARLAELPAESWARATPAAGWTIAHQIAHLHWTDRLAGLSITDPAALTELIGQAVADPTGYVDQAAAEGASVEPAELLRRWRDGRQLLAEQLVAVPAGVKLAWFGPPMSPASMATARLMETWAHGLDVTDALGYQPVASDRLRHVARLAVRTRDFAFRLHERPVPDGEFRIELTGPDGASWTFGPPDAEQRVTGPALDLCLLATQRRNRADLALRAVGPDADAWLDLAQAFAGLPGPGRPAVR
ncbi:MAG: TIGR03084 family metal-binding protein [Actinomycetota bacterium]|nr:TIGR03084 family metal-binding protein [Actinomycetota bacterium]MDQ2955834.1 TIGR03084 family metal-binding protein [Actinomycetota bacterium]